MSLTNLPPICKVWKQEDLQSLTKDEVERLQAYLKNKMEFVTDYYEEYLYYADRNRYLQLKGVQLKERKGKRKSTTKADFTTLFSSSS